MILVRLIEPVVRSHPLAAGWVALMVLICLTMIIFHVPWSL